MLKKGLINEVDALYQRGDVNSTMMPMRAVGYRQVWEFLEGRLDYDSMVLRAIYATRQLAKRQLTWLRGERSIERLGMETCERSDIFKTLDAIRADLV
jgi:tRNA dimethylallyltransferase